MSYGDSATAAQLETVLRGYRRTRRLEEARDDAAKHEQRYVRHWVDEEGFVRISARLSPEDGAFVIGQVDRLAESGGEEHAAAPAEAAASVSAETAEAGRGDAPVVSPGRAASDPIDARRADALRMMAETAAANGPRSCVGGDTHLVVMHVSSNELAEDQVQDAEGTDETPAPADPATAVATTIEGVGRFSAETARRISCDAEITLLVEDALGRPLGVGRQSDKVPRWLRRALKRRDRGCCRFPGCVATRFVERTTSSTGPTAGPPIWQTSCCCAASTTGSSTRSATAFVTTAPAACRSCAPTVPWCRLWPRRRRATTRQWRRQIAQRHLAITPLTSIPDWDGQPPDYRSPSDSSETFPRERRSAHRPPCATAKRRAAPPRLAGRR